MIVVKDSRNAQPRRYSRYPGVTCETPNTRPPVNVRTRLPGQCMQAGQYANTDHRKGNDARVRRIFSHYWIGFQTPLASIHGRISVSESLACQHGLPGPPFPIFVPMLGPHFVSIRPSLASLLSQLMRFMCFLRFLSMRNRGCEES